VDAQLASLKKTNEWERAAFIKKGGSDALPGLKEAVTGVANLCAERLVTEKLPVANRAAIFRVDLESAADLQSANARSFLSTCTKSRSLSRRRMTQDRAEVFFAIRRLSRSALSQR
jgi:hypothetical protein